MFATCFKFRIPVRDAAPREERNEVSIQRPRWLFEDAAVGVLRCLLIDSTIDAQRSAQYRIQTGHSNLLIIDCCGTLTSLLRLREQFEKQFGADELDIGCQTSAVAY